MVEKKTEQPARIGRPPRVEGGSTFVGLRVPDVELEVWRRLAEEAGVSLSRWISDRCNASAKRSSK